MVETQRVVSALPMDLDGVQARYALFAGCEGVQDSAELVDIGLALASTQTAHEMRLSPTQPSEGLSVELGGLLRYTTEKARLEGLVLSKLFSADVVLLDDVQDFSLAERETLAAYDLPPTLPFFDEDGVMVNENLDSCDVLGLITMRVIDIKSRRMDWLWRGAQAEKEEADRIVRDLIVHTSLITDGYGLRLSDIYSQTIDRLSKDQASRPRSAEESASNTRGSRVFGVGRALQHLNLL